MKTVQIVSIIIINLCLFGCKHTETSVENIDNLEEVDSVSVNNKSPDSDNKNSNSSEVEVTSKQDVVQDLLAKITKPSAKTVETNEGKFSQENSRTSDAGIIYCEKEIESIIKEAKLSKNLVERKKLRFGTIIFAKSQNSNFYLFITPMGVFSEETLTMSKYGESVECFEEGEYFQILKDN